MSVLFSLEVRAAIYKICERCHKRIRTGTTCQCRDRRKLRAEQSKDKKADPFYTAGAWRTKRNYIMQMYHGIDVWAMYQGRYEEAEAVHHIKPLKEYPELAYSDDNLIPLSAYSHDQVEKAYNRSDAARIKMQDELLKAIHWYRDAIKN